MKAGGTGYFVAAVLVLSVAIALRVGPLSNESVDGDELFSRRAALARPAEGWKMVRQDLVHPPLYYFLLKATLPTGDSRTASEIRGLSLAAGAATLLTVFAIGIAVPVLRWPAMLAALLLAVNKTHIYYSQQARSYALYCFLAGLLLLWCILADRCWRRWWFWPGGTILMTALVWTHYVGALYCAVCVFPMLFMHYPGSTNRRTGNLLAAASLGSAGVLFLPWLIPEIAIYRAKSGLAENLEWQGVPTLFDLKYAFAQYAGIADFRGATTVALVTGTILVVCALWPTFGKEQFVLDTRIKITLALLALVPAILLFLTTRPPFNLPIFGERHLLPSIVPALMLMSYGLWRVAWVQPRLVLLLGATVLCALQIAPVYYDWPGPVRQPYSIIATDLERIAPDSPVYTTWQYGIAEPVNFYTRGSRNVDEFPATALPAKFVVLYRPAVASEDNVVQPLLRAHDVVTDRSYSAVRPSRFDTRLLVLRRR